MAREVGRYEERWRAQKAAEFHTQTSQAHPTGIEHDFQRSMHGPPRTYLVLPINPPEDGCRYRVCGYTDLELAELAGDDAA